MNPVVIHHSSDYDGQFCGAIARRFLPHAQVIGWDFGDPVPAVSPDTRLYIMDLSIPGLMEHPQLVWIDHHRSAIEKWAYAGPGDYFLSKGSCRIAYVLEGVAACRLAWQYFNDPGRNFPLALGTRPFKDRQVKEPMALTLAGEYDVWDHETSKGKDIDFQYGLDAMPEGWKLDELLSPDYGDVMTHKLTWRGEIARRCYDKRMLDTAKANCFDLEFEGLTFLAMNTPERGSLAFSSQVSNRHDAMLRFNYKNGKWIISMYHVPHRTALDLSEIAVLYGGGGHPGACGFETQNLSVIFNHANRTRIEEL